MWFSWTTSSTNTGLTILVDSTARVADILCDLVGSTSTKLVARNLHQCCVYQTSSRSTTLTETTPIQKKPFCTQLPLATTFAKTRTLISGSFLSHKVPRCTLYLLISKANIEKCNKMQLPQSFCQACFQRSWLL
jgi:hypothetical protein